MKLYSVNIATLKAKLSYYLRLVAHGHSVVILDRKHEVAKLTSIEEKEVDFKTIKPEESVPFTIPKLHLNLKSSSPDPVKLLMEERKKR